MAEHRRACESTWTTVPIDGQDVSIHARVFAAEGDATPVVFVPGLGASGRTLVPTAERLSGFPVFVVDLPGVGSSGDPPHPLDLTGYAGVVAAWLGANGLDRVVLVGHSFGSQVAAEFAVRRPELLERLVLVSPTVDRRARTMRVQVARLLLDVPREPLSLLPALVRDYVQTGAGTLLHMGRLALRDRVETKLPEVRAPTLVVRGDRDLLVPARWAEELAALVPSGRLVVVPGAAHAVTYNSPGQLAGALEEFVEQG